MGKPNWFRYSAVSSPPEQLFQQTAALRAAHRFKPRDIARLGWSEDSGEFEFLGDTLRPLKGDDEVLELARGWEGFTVAYNVLSIRATVYLYFWRWQGANCLGVQIDDQVPYVSVAGMAEGEWLERFICEYTAVAGAMECANGWDWKFSLEPLAPGQLTGELRAGELLTRRLPALYMLSEAQVSPAEMKALLTVGPSGAGLRYFQTSAGYHVLSSLCRRSWCGA